MGEKLYKPIVKDGHHLLHSNDNPERVRGLTRDENNLHPDIIECEEVDLDDLRKNEYNPSICEEPSIQVSEKEKELSQEIAGILAYVILGGLTLVGTKYVFPWWRNSAWPWIKGKGNSIKDLISGNEEVKPTSNIKIQTTNAIADDRRFTEVSSQIDKVFEQYVFEMDEEEAQEHIMKLVYHMLGLANEIRILSNSQIRKECKTEELCAERQKEAEKFLSEKVAVKLNQLLSNKNLQLDVETSKALFSLTGGVRINGEYFPVQAVKIDKTLKTIKPFQS